ncbi:MAG: hypothetical protein C0606_10220 [Hyphomicrobiales bacterium]|nr:MAG: hypothetical protein C0606_10220 [Hyphomicrobiales bacterium]
MQEPRPGLGSFLDFSLARFALNDVVRHYPVIRTLAAPLFLAVLVCIHLTAYGAASIAVTPLAIDADPPYLGVLIVIVLVAGVLWGALAVAWHRFFLLGEKPGWRSVLPGFAALGYFLTAIGLIAAGIGVGFFVSVLGDVAAALSGLPFVAALVWPVAVVAGAYVALRMSPVLPGVALDYSWRSFRNGWSVTRPYVGGIFGWSVVLAALMLAARLAIKALLFVVPLDVYGTNFVFLGLSFAATFFLGLASLTVITAVFHAAYDGVLFGTDSGEEANGR